MTQLKAALRDAAAAMFPETCYMAWAFDAEGPVIIGRWWRKKTDYRHGRVELTRYPVKCERRKNDIAFHLPDEITHLMVDLTGCIVGLNIYAGKTDSEPLALIPTSVSGRAIMPGSTISLASIATLQITGI